MTAHKCCPHCAGDPVHDVETDGHTLPCDLCDPRTQAVTKALHERFGGDWIDVPETAGAVMAAVNGSVGLLLTPEESLALTVALAQVRRGEPPTENVAATCVIVLARIVGRDR